MDQFENVHIMTDDMVQEIAQPPAAARGRRQAASAGAARYTGAVGARRGQLGRGQGLAGREPKPGPDDRLKSAGLLWADARLNAVVSCRVVRGRACRHPTV